MLTSPHVSFPSLPCVLCSVISWGMSWWYLSWTVSITAIRTSALYGPSRRWRSFQRTAGPWITCSCSPLSNPLYYKLTLKAALETTWPCAVPLEDNSYLAQLSSHTVRLPLQNRIRVASKALLQLQQDDAVTKSVPLPFFPAQRASIKFCRTVDYFLYMLFLF